MKNREWEKEDIELLKVMLSDGQANIDIAKELKRTTDSIAWKLKNLGLKRTRRTKGIYVPPEIDESIVKELKANIFNTPIQLEKQVDRGREEKAVLVLSDMHTGTVNEIYTVGKGKEITYNEVIRQKEMLNLRDSVFQITSLFSHAYNIKELNILCLGDMITNDRIFEGQVFQIDRPYGKQMWDTARDLAYFIREMQKKFTQINFYGVVGNHGRSNKIYQEEPVENNYEWTLYKILEQTFEGVKGVKIVVPDTRFYSINIFGHSYYMHHGDNIRGASSNSIERAAKDLLNALVADLPSGFDIYLMGHFHRSDKKDINEKSTVLINGSWIPRDAYGFKMFKQYSKPTQWFFGVNEKRARTWNFELDLTK